MKARTLRDDMVELLAQALSDSALTGNLFPARPATIRYI